MTELSTLTAPIDAEVARWRADQLPRIHRVLDSSAGGTAATANAPGSLAVEFAIDHHRLQGAEDAARSRDASSLGWYRSHDAASFGNLRLPEPWQGHILPHIDPASLENSPIADAPYYLLGQESRPAESELQHLALAALSAAAREGFGPLIDQHAAIICLLRERVIGQTMASWSITRLPGTVYTDHAGDPYILGRDLVHEAAHNWLNSALTLRRISLDDQTWFYSPWKELKRPAFGYLHACWAFPLTMIYASEVLRHLDGPVADFLATYLDKQTALLAHTDTDHERAVAMVSDASLQNVLRTVYVKARAL
ncbi:hypothetical protein KDK95_05815 [Actinospica sp. MGRD01-02]|uniref:HEXXH motif domain-containing protein n=1 Tax=Actinospica acidithermotolerans TaxID=2828514 RepID=A0A941E8N1_9ACTN|nr:HEXXH motif-containing putative peptide modification protein [Actinospica acidithermotolerans]MBR7825817.1 hypothetical protein [Actinospica acidithermotolerans]